MKIFLDDVRVPSDCVTYMHIRIGKLNPIYLEKWKIVQNYTEFVNIVTEYYKEVTHISFDHDLAIGHYHDNMQQGILHYEAEDFDNDANKTGLHCARWMIKFYKEHGMNLPVLFVHSMNPVGTENIINAFK